MTLSTNPVAAKLHPSPPPSTDRAETQHVLSDVTRHMEQQYLAQKSLEKLRAENEALAIRQKDRKVGRSEDGLVRSCTVMMSLLASVW